ncbi:iron-containing alcohol dehydrogenase family protein [Natrarchaeobius oligotrophus]|uniref:Iron-containing alcohol dehydrogenase n=1 Tax=Natrarchaeobius chitinivorans TaxID=1679083 RepID=A0A3N6MPG5_NATCH|nr:iron-containing alcohol dehydrogenase family protein [Natrarchaeobius chitinivorans]RQG99470.1 iron-containing alcohol dehydrogenase [Natrarchaeobius chitinivorans]
MTESFSPFTYDYDGTDILYGRGSIDRIGDSLDDFESDSVLVVCGSNVGSNAAVMEPLHSALADYEVSVFDETTPAKSVATLENAVDRLEVEDPDAIVGIGGGSSLDIARQLSVFAAAERDLSTFRAAALEGRTLEPVPASPLTPVIVVPTTFAGAGLSSGGSIELLSAEDSPTGHALRTCGTCRPQTVVYDPALYETTPRGTLAGSAMNGFNKGIETLYARSSNPITRTLAGRGLGTVRRAFPTAVDDAGSMESAVVGSILVQFRRQTSVIHAFGHGFSYHYPIQQGLIHAVVTPHVLRYVFDRADGNRRATADALGIDVGPMNDDDVAAAIVDDVRALRDSLDLPTRLRDIDAVSRSDFRRIAAFVRDDVPDERAPPGLEPTTDAIERVLHDAW